MTANKWLESLKKIFQGNGWGGRMEKNPTINYSQENSFQDSGIFPVEAKRIKTNAGEQD